jgi:methionyl-tRNA formyltransferase
MSKSFAFLVLEEHPYGREMLARLLEAGLEPALLIEESSSVANEERTKFLERMQGFEIAPSFDQLLAGRALRREQVASHNGERCAALLAELQPDLLVLGGTGILKSAIFEHAADGCLNAHPGLLPEVRGSASVAWAIELDLPIGCTCHFIDAQIDQGPIVSRQEIAVTPQDTYESLCWKTAGLSARLMAQAVLAWRAGSLSSTPQGVGDKTHRNMPEAGVQAIKQKLAAGLYAHIQKG